MAFDKKFYPKNMKPHFSTQFDGLSREHQYFYLRLGLIEDFDQDKYLLRISWYEQNGARDEIPFSFPYLGPAGCIGVFPEKGALAIFGFFNEGGGKGSPLLLGYIPRDLYASLNNSIVKTFPDSIPMADINEIEYRFRKMTVGDAVVRAPAGGYIFLNKNVEITDDMQDSILLREGDQSIISTSLSNFVFADGASVSMGPVMRNGLVLYDASGNKIEGTYGSIHTLPNGKDDVYIVRQGKEIDYSTDYYAEYRVDVDDLADGKLDMNDINGSSLLSIRNPIVTMALGNYVGADKKLTNLYGYPLKARLFASKDDIKGSFTLEKAVQNAGVDEPSILGMAYALHCLKTGAFMGFDKEGHHYLHLPGSRMNPLGSGRSMSILAHGNLKEVWGNTDTDNNSWDLATTGGVRWNIGAHNSSEKSRSLEISLSRSIYIEAGSNDEDTFTKSDGSQITGFAKREVLKGNVLEQVGGSKTQLLNGVDTTINGLKSENITGSAEESVHSDKSVSVLGNYSETVVKNMQCKFGTRKTNIISGDDELEVTRGNIKETITTFGKRSTTVTAGSIEQTLQSGTYKTTIQAGSYSLKVTAGGINISTSAGTVTMSGTTVSVKGSLSVSIPAPIVQIGQNAPFGGAVTGLPGLPSTYDPITGVPLKGSMTVGIAI